MKNYIEIWDLKIEGYSFGSVLIYGRDVSEIFLFVWYMKDEIRVSQAFVMYRLPILWTGSV